MSEHNPTLWPDWLTRQIAEAHAEVETWHPERRDAMRRQAAHPPPVRDAMREGEGDDCYRCWDERTRHLSIQDRVVSRTMFLCPACGHKRCPKASDHRLACTGSNAPGQPGSVYP